MFMLNIDISTVHFLKAANYRYFAVAVVLLSLCFSPQIVCAQNNTLMISTGEWAPYVSKEIAGGGMSREIVEAALNEAGLDFEMCFFPWKRAMLSMKNGQYGASFPWVKRKSREKYSLYSGPLHKYKISLFYLKDKYPEGIENTSVTALKNLSIGVVRGYVQGVQYKEMGLRVIELTDNEMGIQMLVRGYIDLMSESSDVGRYVINKIYPDQKDRFGDVAAPIESESLYMLFPKVKGNSPDILRKFNAGLKKIKENGKYDHIVQKYGVSY